MNPQYQTSRETITTLADDVRDVAQRSLKLLKAIEDTVDRLCYDQRIYSTFAAVAHEMLDRVKAVKMAKVIDQDGKAADSLQIAQVAARELYDDLVPRHKAAVADKRLTRDDGVAEEYQRLIQIVSNLHDALNDLRWAIGEHDVDLCEIDESAVLSSEEEISNSLK